MIAIISVFVVTFAIVGIMGLLFYRSPAWDFVDLVYYPLAALGVVLLFANTTIQRQLFELDQLTDRHRVELQQIVSTKPNVQVMTSNELLDASVGIILTIPKLAKVCRNIPKVDPQCIVAKKLEPPLNNFINASEARYASHELRLSSLCSAADRLLGEIRTKEQISPLIGAELIAQYKTALSRNYDPLAYDAVMREVDVFEKRALERIEWLRNALNDDSESSRHVLSIYREEVHFGGLILRGLYPCIAAPKASLDLLTKWTVSRQSKEEAISQIERDRQQIQKSGSDNPVLLWMQLNLWPFVLIAALALKFSKGIATVLKARAGKMGPIDKADSAGSEEGAKE